jgi:hypothetical protein
MHARVPESPFPMQEYIESYARHFDLLKDTI